MKKLLTYLPVAAVAAFGFIVATVAPMALSQPVSAATDLTLKKGAETSKSKDQPEELVQGEESMFKKITNVMLFVTGAISVIMLIIGGIRYVVSSGDAGAVSSAKNTILYAIVGIIVTILAFAIVNFVISNFTSEQQ